MADEFSITVQVNYSSSLAVDDFSESFQDDQASAGQHCGIVSVTTSCAAVSEGALTTPGWVTLKNLDPSNFVTYGPDSGGVMIPTGRLDPGESNAIKLSTACSLRWVADTAACKVQYKMWER